MDRTYRNKIKKNIEKASDDMEVNEKLPVKEGDFATSAEKLVALLPNNINKAKLIAQIYSGKAFDTLVEIMCDDSIPPDIRRKCANDLLNRGYGMPEQNIKSINVGATVEIPPETFTMTDVSIEANAYIESGVPSSEWPSHIKRHFGILEE